MYNKVIISFIFRFVEYSEQEGANVAIQNLNGYQTGGCTLKVSKALTRDSGNKGAEMNVASHSEPKVHVMNIPLDMTEVSKTNHVSPVVNIANY